MALLNPGNAFSKIYCAPGDPSNPGTGTLLTSYCANGAVFDGQHGGSARFPGMFHRGTTNGVLFFERFAVPNGVPRAWNDPGPRRVWLYSPYDGDSFDAFPYSQPRAAASVNTGFYDRNGNAGEVDFGTTPETASHVDKPHAFTASGLNVLLGDGSVRPISSSVNTTASCGPIMGGQPVQARVWAWACAMHGTLGETVPPAGW
jgi:hypothetical protein